MAGGRMVRREQSFSRMAWTVVLAVLAALGLACSDAGPAPVDVTAGQAEAADDSTKMAEDAADSPGDAAGSDAAAALGCDFPAAPMPGQPGAACGKGKDCDSGWCVEGPTGKVCSRLCSSCCPAGFSCEAPSPQDPVFICISKLNALCRPCDQDSECQGLSSGALCVGDAVQGRFCGGACSDDDECPANYQCLTVQGTKGAGLQCVRIEGECPCSARSVAEGASTSCAKVNSAGSCTGQRKCLLTGLSACNAAAPATETCGGGDEDCDGATDEAAALNCQTWYPDQDGDGYASSSAAGSCVCTAAGAGYAAVLGDCDDAAKAVSPVASENCNGIDDDCDGKTDEGSADLDGDGSADCIDVDIDGDGSLNAADCAPTNPAINPTATEACNGADDDCDGATDEVGATGCTPWYIDGDGDKVGVAASGQCQCGASASHSASQAGDCNDGNPAVAPGAPESCDGLDNDCDGATDETGATGCTPWYIDGDGDKVGVAASAQCQCGASASHSASKAGDCDDGNPAVAPGASEACDGKDNDCDGATDEPGAAGCKDWYADGDGDKVGVAASAQCQCGATLSHPASKAGDCNDANPAIAPGASEACDGLDNDCDGATDPAKSFGCSILLADQDKDGYGSPADSQCLCKPAFPYTSAKGGDCNDQVASQHPGVAEACDGIDNNCDGVTDGVDAQNCSLLFVDADKDGYGNALAAPKCLCGSTGSYTAVVSGDCDDTDLATHPKAVEQCDGKDTDCDGIKDPKNAQGCKVYYLDFDNDGFGANNLNQCQCSAEIPYTVLKAGDCNDTTKMVNPGMLESCNQVDDNCNGQTDDGAPGTTSYYQDGDGDGFGIGSAKLLCGASAPHTATKAGDCNDGAKTVYPGAAEIQCNTVDENCDGKDSCTAAGHICDTSCGSASPPPGATVACACDLYCPMNGDCCNPTGTGFAANCGTQSSCIWCKAF